MQASLAVQKLELLDAVEVGLQRSTCCCQLAVGCVQPCREKDQPGRMRYTSYWRPTANGKTDYLSITIVNNATAQVRVNTPI